MSLLSCPFPEKSSYIGKIVDLPVKRATKVATMLIVMASIGTCLRSIITRFISGQKRNTQMAPIVFQVAMSQEISSFRLNVISKPCRIAIL
jgi:hypothetical protein